jgi:hypothetical protein
MKKRIITAIVLLTVVFSLFLPPVRTFAVEALSVFRVGRAHTITVTLADLDTVIAYAERHADLWQSLMPSGEYPYSASANPGEWPSALPGHGNGQYPFDIPDGPLHSGDGSLGVKLNDISEFTAFPVKTPGVINGATPEIVSTEPYSARFSFNADEYNALLLALGDTPVFDPALNGAEITVHTPAAVMLKYPDMIIAATQAPYAEAEAGVLESIRQTTLGMPFISDNLRVQLSAIDIGSRDIYLPVLMGFGREVLVGNTQGIIYTLADLMGMAEQMTAQLIGDMNPESFDWGSIDPESFDWDSIDPESFDWGSIDPESFDWGSIDPESFDWDSIDSESFDWDSHISSDIDFIDDSGSFPENFSVLIWADDGVMYCIAADKTDGDLINIAAGFK